MTSAVIPEPMILTLLGVPPPTLRLAASVIYWDPTEIRQPMAVRILWTIAAAETSPKPTEAIA